MGGVGLQEIMNEKAKMWTTRLVKREGMKWWYTMGRM